MLTLIFNPYFVACVFPKIKTFIFPDFMQSFRVCSFLLSPICQHFFSIFASIFCEMLKISPRPLVSNNVVSCLKTWLYRSNTWKYGSWCNYFNVRKSKKEIMVSRISTICSIFCPTVSFVWSYASFGPLKTFKAYAGSYNGQFMIFMYAILLQGQSMTFMQPAIIHHHI